VQVPEDAVDHTAVGPPRVPGLVVVVAVGEEGGDARPLGIGEFIAVHGASPFGKAPSVRGRTNAVLCRDYIVRQSLAGSWG
jgi:hypothetical protein